MGNQTSFAIIGIAFIAAIATDKRLVAASFFPNAHVQTIQRKIERAHILHLVLLLLLAVHPPFPYEEAGAKAYDYTNNCCYNVRSPTSTTLMKTICQPLVNAS